jgi:hypothetical protein
MMVRRRSPSAARPEAVRAAAAVIQKGRLNKS